MNAQHTPGPWRVLDHQGVHVLDKGSLTIATVPYQIDYARVSGRGVQIQNAHLIAAAPELLEALTFLMACRNLAGSDSFLEAEQMSRAAIAKATGEAQ